MADQLQRYEKYAGYIKRLLVLSGLWLDPIYSKRMKCLSTIYAILLVLATYSTSNFIYHHLGDVTLMVRAFGLCVGASIAFMKLVIFWANHDDLQKMHDILENGFRKDMENPEYQTKMLSSLKYFYSPTYMLSRSSVGLILVAFLNGPISIILQIYRGASPIVYFAPVLSQYPWDLEHNFGLYMIRYVLEISSGLGGALIHTSYDCAFGYYVYQMGAQFQCLSHNMRNLKSTDNYRAGIEECVLRHQLLAECCDTLDRVYGPIALVFMITSAMFLCTSLFLISKMSSTNLMMSIIYLWLKTLQAFLYGWFGLFLTTESENFRDAVYSSGWPGSGEIPFMKDVLIMLARKPLSVSVCGFTVISLDMFTAIVNTGVSYYFLLVTIEESK